jgi:hypothetical protein
MQRTIRRLGLVIFSGLALSAFTAAPALATTLTTEPTSHRTATTAVLHGVIDTGGAATAWQFQWGRTKSYGHSTQPEQIPAGGGTVSVSSTLQNLKPNTTYHFRLVATTGTGASYYPLNVTFGNDLTFKTNRTGRLLLAGGTRLTVKNGAVSVPLRCRSGLSCQGRFTIGTNVRVKHSKKLATVRCVTAASYNIAKHGTKTISAKVSGACLALLRGLPNQSHTAKLTSNPRTGQHALIKFVTLVLM